ncbi:MAG: hypothetical protein ACSHX3_12875 [Litorimonas sp.]
MTAIVWVHADALSRQHPVFAAAPENARAVYVWDADDLAQRGWSLKRCVFVLECLADMNVDILQGSTVDVLSAIRADRIFTPATPDPHRLHVIDALTSRIVVVPSDPFVTVPEGTDMGRFFRYWNKAKRSALRPTEEGTSIQGTTP